MDSEEKALELLKLVHGHFQNDFRRFWTRFNTLLITNVALLSFYSSDFFSTDSYAGLAALVELIGLTISVVWLYIVINSNIWIDKWRKAAAEIEKDVSPYRSFFRGEEDYSRKRSIWSKLRVEWASCTIPLSFMVAWFTLLFKVELS